LTELMYDYEDLRDLREAKEEPESVFTARV
jgi:hypothetical protein